MSILNKKFYLEDEYDCPHCGSGGVYFDLKENKFGYELTSRFLCLTFDDESTVWRGQSVTNLIKSIKADPGEYRLNIIQGKELIAGLGALIGAKIVK
jgi:hypothetical protein